MLVVVAIWAVVQAGFSSTTVEDSAEAVLKRGSDLHVAITRGS
jgi:hypothetical protein